MYEAFFHLHEKPFNLTPSHRFLYLSEGHKEALALLTYGVIERKGFILLTGDAGTGKTTLIQALLNNLGEDVEFVHVSNPLLSAHEFMDYLASSTFKRRIHFKSKSDFLFEFEDYLKDAQQHQRAFILIIDEAQALSLDVLEEIRLLSNLESSEQKLINIFLVGQPELAERLRDPKCKALYQRIASRYHLQPLNAEETGHYVATRLQVAGARDPKDLFPKRTIDALYRHSEGIPRTINILADNALLLGYSKGKASITPDMIEASHRDMHLGEEVLPVAAESNLDRVQGQGRGHVRRSTWWVIAIAVLMVMGAFLAGARFSGFLGPADPLHQERKVSPPVDSVEEPARPSLSQKIPSPETKPPIEPNATQPREPGDSSGESLDSPVRASPASGLSSGLPEVEALTELEEEGIQIQRIPAGDSPADLETASLAGATRVVVKKGDYLARLAMKTYGRADPEVLEMVRERNPDLQDVHKLTVGQVLVFPPLSSPPRERIYTVYIASYRRNADAQEAFHALSKAGYDVFVVPFHTPERGMLYRVTVGNFSASQAAKAFADKLLERPDIPSARVIQLDTGE